VSGPFTAPVVDADVDAALPWLATAYVPGPSLDAAVAERGPLPTWSVLKLAAGLAEGLSAIHAAGVAHRDLKPSNVLLAKDGPRLIDFGISRASGASALSHPGLLVGSPGFMSPEQAEGQEAGPPGDVFSLGAVLAFAATGEGPFGAGSTLALVYRVIHCPPDLDLVPAEVQPLVAAAIIAGLAGAAAAAGVTLASTHHTSRAAQAEGQATSVSKTPPAAFALPSSAEPRISQSATTVRKRSAPPAAPAPGHTAPLVLAFTRPASTDPPSLPRTGAPKTPSTTPTVTSPPSAAPTLSAVPTPASAGY
jgi:serine/threonine protein kinase